MRIDPARHAEHPWRVHELAHDFTLLDLWEIPLAADPTGRARFSDFNRLVAHFDPAAAGRATSALFALRARLGRWFGWDDTHELPIPGCNETRVAQRLTDDDRRRSQPPPPLPHDGLVTFDPVYLFEDESLSELSNRTIHALMHLCWVDPATARLAIYIKPRGLMSRFYMAAIGPFRHAIVYPSWIRSIQSRWADQVARAG
jgi:hypothetical protein